MSYREFTDREGRTWRAWDTYPQSRSIVTAAFAQGWLCFESEAGKRRLTPIPHSWEEMPPERLDLLLRAADEVVPLRVEEDAPPADPEPPLP